MKILTASDSQNAIVDISTMAFDRDCCHHGNSL